jgi:hypothetical protein
MRPGSEGIAEIGPSEMRGSPATRDRLLRDTHRGAAADHSPGELAGGAYCQATVIAGDVTAVLVPGAVQVAVTL